MSLTHGTRLGPYEVLSLLGSGGMGEVYRGRDPRLGRDVAIKVLPGTLATDPERLQRFEQEARAAAALNHPTILAVFDIGRHELSPYIVSELLEGETLRERVKGGPLPVRKVVEYAFQIAHGLAAAHERGIVHRDLKPENVFITADGRLKILDFGLAKLMQGEGAPAGVSALPTAAPGTTPGMVLGTVGYMSPEQVRGLAADSRSDIFALGAIVYEMLTGERAFRGETTADTMSAILKETPPDRMTGRALPPALPRIVDRCLEKNPTARFQSAGDLAFALEALSGHSGPAEPVVTKAPAAGRREKLAWALVAALLVAVAALVAVLYPRGEAVDSGAFVSTLALTDGVTTSAPPNRMALSPDGRRLAFAQGLAGSLRIRDLGSPNEQPLANIESATAPFWSPDGTSLAFFTEAGRLQTVDVSSGRIFTVAAATDRAEAPGTWNQNGLILFSPSSTSPIMSVPATGGTPAPVTALNASAGETQHAFPHFLPDGRSFLYLALNGNTPLGVYAGTLGSMERTRVVEGGSNAMYAQGFLIYVRGTALVAQRFDAERLATMGPAVPLADQVQVSLNDIRGGAFSVSQNGVLVYMGGAAGQTQVLSWLDTAGTQLGVVGPAGLNHYVELSPDGTQVSVSRQADSGGEDVWLADIAGSASTRFTLGPGDEESAVWWRDGRRLIFAARRSARLDLYQQSTSREAEELLLSDDRDKYPSSVSPDGRFLLYRAAGSSTGDDLWVLPLSGDRRPSPFRQTPFQERDAKFSPDGRWVAYTSDETGTDQVYIAPFQGGGGRRAVSNGGSQPRWRPDGRELFYRTATEVMAAPIMTSRSTLETGAPRPLFAMLRRGIVRGYQYDVSPDGQRFLMVTAPGGSGQTAAIPITLVVNWPALLRQ